jgi:hypothetical protein
LNHDEAGADYENPLTINRFAYVQNRPTIMVDPDGRLGQLAILATRAWPTIVRGAQASWNFIKNPNVQQRAANASVSFSNGYGTARLMGENRLTASLEGTLAAGTSFIFNKPGLASNPYFQQGMINTASQSLSIAFRDDLTFKNDFSISSLGYSVVAGGTLDYALGSINITRKVGGISGLLAASPFNFGLNASFAGLGQIFGSGGNLNYTSGDLLNYEIGFENILNNFMNSK